jgi:hypothetical protein
MMVGPVSAIEKETIVLRRLRPLGSFVTLGFSIAFALTGSGEAQVLLCDIPTVGSIDSPTESDSLTFSVSDNEVILFTVDETAPSGASFGVEWRILDGNGNAAADCGTFSILDHRDCTALPVAGNPYTLEIRDQFQDDVGTYVAHLQRLTLPYACEDSTTAVACDVPFVGTLDDPIDNDLVSFDATDGDFVHVTVLESSLIYSLSWRVVDRAGNPAPMCGSFSAISDGDCGPLLASGSPYRIQIRETDLDAVGDYTIHLQRLTAAAACDVTPLLCDVPLTGSIEHRIDTDLLSFSVTPGEIVNITLDEIDPFDPGFEVEWRVLDASGTPAASCGTFSNLDNRDCPNLPATGSPYHIEVRDRRTGAALGETGDYAAHLQRLTRGKTCEIGILLCDTPLGGTLEVPIDNDLVAFGAADGEIVHITVLEDTTGYSVSWRVVDRFGSPAPTCGTFSASHDGDCGPLLASGSPYSVQIRESELDGVGDYTIHLQRLTSGRTCDDDDVLVCDTPLTGSIEDRIDTDLLRFSIAPGEILNITLDEIAPFDPGFDVEWRVLDSLGNPAASCGTFSDVDNRDCANLPSTGNPYRIEIRDRVGLGLGEAGDYVAHLQRLTLPQGCEDSTAVLVCDVPFVGTLDDPIDNDLVSFEVADGEIVHVTVLEDSPGYSLSWRVIDRLGRPAASCGTFSAIFDGDCGPLPESGSPYRVQVRETQLDAAGGYTIHLQHLNAAQGCDDVALICDVPLTGSIEHRIDTDLLRFSVTAGEVLNITLGETDPSDPGFQVEWRVLDALGNPATSCGTFSNLDNRDCANLPFIGNPYRIEVRDWIGSSVGAAGTYVAHVQRLTLPQACEDSTTVLTCDAPFVGTLDDPFDNDLVSFDVAEGEIVHIAVLEDSLSYSLSWRVIDRFGSPAPTCGSFSAAFDGDCGPLLTSRNPYRIQVRETELDAAGDYTIHLQRLTADEACDDAALACDTPLPGSIEDRIDTDLLSFNVVPGEILNLTLDEIDPFDPGFEVEWRVLDAAGNPAPSCGTFSNLDNRDCANLPTIGNPYRIEVRDRIGAALGET